MQLVPVPVPVPESQVPVPLPVLETVLKYSSSTSTIIQYYNPGARFTKYLTIYHTIIVSLS